MSLDVFMGRLNAARAELSYAPITPTQDGETVSRRNYTLRLSKVALCITEEVKASRNLEVITVGSEGRGALSDSLDVMSHLITVIRAVDPRVTVDRGTALVKDMLTGIERTGSHRIRLHGASASCLNAPVFVCIFRPEPAAP